MADATTPLAEHPATTPRSPIRFAPLAIALVLSACAPMRPAPPTVPPQPEVRPPVDKPVVIPEPVDPMGDFRGDAPFVATSGPVDQFDCMVGRPDLQARIAFETRGGTVTNFSYYSRWSSYTCSIDLAANEPKTSRWRRAADGATRVQTPHGIFLIRSGAEDHVFEFQNIQRMKYCGMFGRMSGAMRVQRVNGETQCSAEGILDRDGK